jgi:chromosome segregation ATPase
MTSSGEHAIVGLVDQDALERARERLDEAAQRKTQPSDVEAALERARAQVEELAATAAELESTLPDRVGEAVRDGIRSEARPVSRQLAEVRGLANQTIRRLERIETELLTERNSRVDDLGLLVDLIESGWRAVDDRLRRIEEALHDRQGATVYRIGEAS